MTEFALVAPVFFFLLFAFFQMAIIAYNKQVMENAALMGSISAMEATGPISNRFANDKWLTYYGAATGPIFAENTRARDTCRRPSLNADVRNRGWDWGCLYNIWNGQNYNPRTGDWGPWWPSLAVAYPPEAGVREANLRLRQLYIGTPAYLRIQACYALPSTATTASGCYRHVSTMTQTGAVTNSTALNYGYDYAPSYIRVTVDASSFKFLPFVPGPGTIRTSVVLPIDRFIPSCPAPSSAGGYAVGTCGWVF